MARSTFFQDLSLLPSPWARLFLRFLILFIRPLVEVRHRRRLDRLPQPTIFAFNHNNAFEALAVPALLIFLRRGRLIHFFIDWMYLRIPVLGWVLRQCQPIPVFTKKARWDLWRGYRRRQSRRNPIAEALEKVRRGGCIGIFPEGTRNRHLDELSRGRLGVSELVLGAEVPVVPVGIQFTARHRLGRIPTFGRIRLVVGEPLDFTAERALAAVPEDPAMGSPVPPRPSMELRRHIVHRVMEALSEVSSKAYPYRRPTVVGAPMALPSAGLTADRLEVL